MLGIKEPTQKLKKVESSLSLHKQSSSLDIGSSNRIVIKGKKSSEIAKAPVVKRSARNT
jgi:hypothetical protein